MDGTVHLALGNSLHRSSVVSTRSAIHWDMVEDLRPAGSGRRARRRGRPAGRRLARLARFAMPPEAAVATPAGPVPAGPAACCCHRFSSIRVIGQKVTEPPKSSVPAAKTRAPAGCLVVRHLAAQARPEEVGDAGEHLSFPAGSPASPSRSRSRSRPPSRRNSSPVVRPVLSNSHGETVGGCGIEIDSATPDSPPGTVGLRPRHRPLRGRGLSGEMS